MAKYWKSSAERQDHYQEVTQQIIALLEQGILPWRQQWDGSKCEVPRNGATGHVYRGINRVMMDMRSLTLGADPRWCSYRQAVERGWQVRKGAVGTRIYFYRRIEKKGHGSNHVEEGRDHARREFFPLLKAYTVFHFSQIDGVPDYQAPAIGHEPWQKPEAVQVILDATGIEVRTVGDRACYIPSQDVICLPPVHAFANANLWAEVALHEMLHATGASSRLNRRLSTKQDSNDYALEELIVSLGVSMMGPILGLTVDVANQASYIDDWLIGLRRDKRMIFKAAAEAQRATDYLLALHPDYAASEAEPTPESDTEADPTMEPSFTEAA